MDTGAEGAEGDVEGEADKAEDKGARGRKRDSPLYKLFGAGWVQKGVGGIFLKIRPHSCV